MCRGIEEEVYAPVDSSVSRCAVEFATEDQPFLRRHEDIRYVQICHVHRQLQDQFGVRESVLHCWDLSV